MRRCSIKYWLKSGLSSRIIKKGPQILFCYSLLQFLFTLRHQAASKQERESTFAHKNFKVLQQGNQKAMASVCASFTPASNVSASFDICSIKNLSIEIPRSQPLSFRQKKALRPGAVKSLDTVYVTKLCLWRSSEQKQVQISRLDNTSQEYKTWQGISNSHSWLVFSSPRMLQDS